MKVCEKCGEPIEGQKDGDNICPDCDKKKVKRDKANAKRRAMNAAMKSIGMTKVRGSMGGTYWE